MFTHLVLRLESPLLAFGKEAVDNLGVIQDFPALSMVTGLLANAMGWDRREGERLMRLQSALIMGSILVQPGKRITDFQTAKLTKGDKGWTTAGQPEGRPGGAADTYDSPLLRYRDYHADLVILVVIRLAEGDALSSQGEALPSLSEIAHALDHPARPLFLGRKPCLPSSRIVRGWVEAESIPAALQILCDRWQGSEPGAFEQGYRAQWPQFEAGAAVSGARVAAPTELQEVADERNWISGFHGGLRPVVVSRIRPEVALNGEL